jgi:hypothetical protein
LGVEIGPSVPGWDLANAAEVARRLRDMGAGIDDIHRHVVGARNMPEPTSFASLLDQHRDIVRAEPLWERIQAFRDDPTGGALLVSGLPGTGKTAILASLVLRDGSIPH